MVLSLKNLEEIRDFYNWKLKDKSLTEKQRDSFLLALKSIENIIREKEDLQERTEHNKFIPDDHKKAVFRNDKRSY